MFSIFVIARTERCVLPWVNGICTSKRKENSNAIHDVVHNGENRRYPKSEVWGYRDVDGKSYRFVDNDAYEIREAGFFVA